MQKHKMLLIVFLNHFLLIQWMVNARWIHQTCNKDFSHYMIHYIYIYIYIYILRKVTIMHCVTYWTTIMLDFSFCLTQYCINHVLIRHPPKIEKTFWWEEMRDIINWSTLVCWTWGKKNWWMSPIIRSMWWCRCEIGRARRQVCVIIV